MQKCMILEETMKRRREREAKGGGGRDEQKREKCVGMGGCPGDK